MGRGYPGTRMPSTLAGRVAEFRYTSPGRCSQRRDVVEFGRYRRIDDPESEGDGGPDLDNAVSTLVVRALPSKRAGAPAYWLRKVYVIGLAEVFYNYQHDAEFAEIYEMWLEGVVVIRKRGTRGVVGAGSGAKSCRSQRRE